MASQPQPSDSHPNVFRNITLNSDGSLTRPTVFPSLPATPQLTTDSQLTLSKDIPLNPTTATFLRLYRPVTPRNQKLPIIIYFHGGGFLFWSTTDAPTHLLCSEISAQSPAFIISVEYRLAPEHRLPAAYEDGVDAIMWVRDQALRSKVDDDRCDEWLTETADFSKVYLMGTSAGGNLTHYTCLRSLDHDLAPITIVGLIFDQPFFGGVEPTKSELRLVDDPVLPLDFGDTIWSLALPLGFDKDHEYCNPLGDQHNEKIKRLPKCLIRARDGDPLVDRIKEFANMLEAHGVHVTRKFYKEGCHGVEIFDPKKAQILYDDVKSFI